MVKKTRRIRQNGSGGNNGAQNWGNRGYQQSWDNSGQQQTWGALNGHQQNTSGTYGWQQNWAGNNGRQNSRKQSNGNKPSITYTNLTAPAAFFQPNTVLQPTFVQPNLIQQPTIVQPNLIQQPTLVQPNLIQQPTLVQPNLIQQPTLVQQPTLLQPNIGKPDIVQQQQAPVIDHTSVINRQAPVVTSTAPVIYDQTTYYGAPAHHSYGYPQYGYSYGYNPYGYTSYFGMPGHYYGNYYPYGSTFAGVELGLGLGLGANYLFGQKYTAPANPAYVPKAQAGLYADNQVGIKHDQPVIQQPQALAAATGAPPLAPAQVTQPIIQPPPADHYAVLGVKRNSNSKTIKNSYNRIKNAMSKKNTKQELKQSVDMAYNTLTNSNKRKTYNSSINDWLKKNPPSVPKANIK